MVGDSEMCVWGGGRGEVKIERCEVRENDGCVVEDSEMGGGRGRKDE